jgi:hypothetical protein
MSPFMLTIFLASTLLVTLMVLAAGVMVLRRIKAEQPQHARQPLLLELRASPVKRNRRR